jgi:hypothetical protein
MAVRGSSTNALHGQFQGYNADGIPIYVHQYGIAIHDNGDATGLDTTELGAQAYQGRPYGSTMILLDDEKNFYIAMNGQRTGDSYVGQIPYMCFDVMTGGKTNPIFRLPLQRANAWVPYSTNWVDAFSVDEQYGHATIHSNLTVGGSIGVQTPTSRGGYIGADYTGYMRLGLVSKYGSKPMLAGVNGEPIIFAHSDSGGLYTPAIESQTFTEDLRINDDKSATFFGDVSAPSLTATNFIAMPTNYVASRYTPEPGKVKICVSNNVMHTVTMTKTNILTTFDP